MDIPSIVIQISQDNKKIVCKYSAHEDINAVQAIACLNMIKDMFNEALLNYAKEYPATFEDASLGMVAKFNNMELQ